MLQIVLTFIGYYTRYITKDERGVTAIEYGLIAALIAIVIIGFVRTAGVALQGVFEDVATALSGLPPS